MSTSLDEVYEELVHTAKTDPDVLGFILCGSRGKGFATAQSDYDCAMVVTDDAYKDKLDRMSMLPASLDIGVQRRSTGEFGRWDAAASDLARMPPPLVNAKALEELL